MLCVFEDDEAVIKMIIKGSVPQMTAAKVMDVIARLPGM